MIFHSFLSTSLFSSALPWDILGTKLAGVGGGGREGSHEVSHSKFIWGIE